MRTAEWTDSVSVLDRVTAVFEAFGDHDEGLGVSELARRANLPKSTVSRIAADLVGQRFLDREGDKLYLGVRLFELGQTVEQPRRLRQLALPVMSELRSATGLTVHLAVLQGADIVLVSILRADPTPQPLIRIGGRLPAHATALGKAILAFSPASLAQQVADGPLTPRTAQTVTKASALLAELLQIRRSGVAFENGECVADRICIGSAVIGHGAAPVAAISVTASMGAIAPERVAPAVRAAAMTLSRRITAPRGH